MAELVPCPGVPECLRSECVFHSAGVWSQPQTAEPARVLEVEER